MSTTDQITFGELTILEPTEYDLSPRERLKRHCRQRHREWFWSEYDRDDYVCPGCHRREVNADGPLHVHHRDGDWLNGHPLNLIAYCEGCHKYIHEWHGRMQALNEWKQGFLALGNESNKEL